MANVAVVGAQWGDEGKGKIVDWLSLGADARRVSEARADYLRAPRRLYLRVAGKPSINALDILARTPADMFEELEVVATTQAGEDVRP